MHFRSQRQQRALHSLHSRTMWSQITRACNRGRVWQAGEAGAHHSRGTSYAVNVQSTTMCQRGKQSVALCRVWRCAECGAVLSVALCRVWRCAECGAVLSVALCRGSCMEATQLWLPDRLKGFEALMVNARALTSCMAPLARPPAPVATRE